MSARLAKQERDLLLRLKKRRRAGEPLTPDEKQFMRNQKLEKWGRRATAWGIDFAGLSKKERRIFKAQWRVDCELGKLEKIIAGPSGKGAAAPPDEREASLNIANAGDVPEIAERTRARIRKSL